MACAQNATEEESFTKLVLYLQKPCLKLLRALLKKRFETLYAGQTVFQILQEKKAQLLNTRHGHNNKSRYFPVDATGDDQPTNLDTWDIGMYVMFLTHYCNWHGRQGNVIEIKKLRDEVCHLGFPQISLTDYTRHFNTIDGFIKDILSFVGDATLAQEIQLDVANIERPVAKDWIEYAKGWHRLYQGDQALMELVQDHKSVTESHGQMFEKLFTELQDVKLRLPQDVIARASPPDNASVVMRLKNCSPEEEDEMSALLVGCFIDEINHTEELKVSGVDCEKLKSAVRHAFHTLCNGRVSNAEQGCIILHVKFSSFASFLDFIDDVFSGAVNDTFGTLQTAMRDTFNKPELEVDVVMNTDQFAYCFQYIMECLKKLLPSSKREAFDTETSADLEIDSASDNTKPSKGLSEKDVTSSKKFAIVTPFSSLDPSSLIAESLSTESHGAESQDSSSLSTEMDVAFELVDLEQSPNNENEGFQMMNPPFPTLNETTKPQYHDHRPFTTSVSGAVLEDKPNQSHSGGSSSSTLKDDKPRSPISGENSPSDAGSAINTIRKCLEQVKVCRFDADELERQLQGELLDKWSESCKLVKGTRIRVDSLGAYLDHLVDAYDGIDMATRRKMEGIFFSKEAWQHQLIEWKFNTGNESGSRYGMIALCKSPDGIFFDCMCVLYKMTFNVSPRKSITRRENSALFGLITWTTTDEQIQERTLGAYSIRRLKNFFRLKALKGFYQEGIIESIDCVKSLTDVPP